MASLAIKRLRLGVIAFYLVLFAGLALYDERPNPKMIEEVSRPLAEVAAPDNAYILLLGFDAPEGKNPYEWGLGKLREVENAAATKANIGEYLLSSLNDKEKLSFKGERPNLYHEKNKGILKFLSQYPSAADKLTRENRELLGRYKSLHSYSAFQEPLDLSYYMPIFALSPVRSVHVLYLFELADLARKGSLAGALEGLQKDIESWKGISRNSNTLISKLVCFSQITTDIRFAAELGTIKKLSAKEMAMLRNVVTSFDSGEASMIGAFRGEARYMYKGAELTVYRSSTPFDRFLLKRNATDNRLYANIQEWIRMAELSPEQFAVQAKIHESEENALRKSGVPLLYNPAGEILGVIMQFQGQVRYIERGHNLEGLRRLAWLKVMARQENIPPEQMQQFLDAKSAEFKDPYTGESMKWDTEKGCIYFKQVTEDKRVEMFL